MKKTIRKWALRISATFVLLIGLLVAIVLNPSFLYANKTTYRQYTIMHQQSLPVGWESIVEQSDQLLSKSELYDSRFSLQICLNDGSSYPGLIKRLMGPAFARGFYNKIVLHGKADVDLNTDELNGRKWNLAKLLTHEAIHCLEYNKYGLWKSKPIANIPNWKWEGYPEYIARGEFGSTMLIKRIGQLIEIEKRENDGWFGFEDGTGCSIVYAKYWVLVTYTMEIRKWSFDDLLKDNTSEEKLWGEMVSWYNKTQGLH